MKLITKSIINEVYMPCAEPLIAGPRGRKIMYDKRWESVAAGIILCNVPGCIFVFSVYSGALKTKYALSQGTLQLVGLSGQASQPFSWVWGMVNDSFGPRAAVTLAGFFATGSYLVQWLVVRTNTFGHMSTNSTMIAISVCTIVFNFGSDLIIAAVFATNIRNFPAADESGSVAGLLKCALGLTGAIITQMYTGFVGAPTDTPSTLDFLLFESIFLFCCTLFPGPFIRVLDPSKNQRKHQCSKQGFTQRMRNGYLFFSLVALCCFVSSLLQTGHLSPSALKHTLLPLALCILVLYLLLIPAILHKLPSWCCKQEAEEVEDGQHPHDEPLLLGDEEVGDGDESLVEVASLKETGQQSLHGIQLPEMRLVEMILTLDCWLFYLSCACCLGGGYFYATNLHQICESAGVGSAAVCVTFFSISNAASRVITGHFTDVGMKRGISATAEAMANKQPTSDSAHSASRGTVRAMLNTRPAFLLYLNAGMICSQLLALWAAHIKSALLLYIAVTFGGLAFGGVFPQIVIVTSELFGKKHCGGNVMFLNGWTGCVPALGFGKYLADAVYHAHLKAGHSGGDSKTCYGAGCFGQTHVIIAMSCLLGMLFTTALCFKSLPLYRRIWELQCRQRQLTCSQ